MASGMVPDIIKEAYITPIIKKPQLDKTDITNYRPISNFSVIWKLLESAVCAQLAVYLDCNKLMPPNQSAYRNVTRQRLPSLLSFQTLLKSLTKGI